MSFGWSAGDLVAAVKLVNKIIKSVGSVGGAREHFQELKSELGGLLQALNDISELTSLPGQPPEVSALKFAACLCEDTLKRFYEKIKPFDAALAESSQLTKLKATPRMVRWELLIKKDIPEFRSYLVAHVGSLNLRLSTAALKIASRTITASNKDHDKNLESAEVIREQLSLQAHVICAKINSISQADGFSRLDSLLTTATNVWKAQSEMMETFAKVLQKGPPPDLRHTWAQAPVRFEDALGRVIPVPSEYDWDKLEAIIKAQFKTGPGHSKVLSGEYELFNGFDEVNAIKASSFCLVPGMNITMAFIVGQYADSQRCPRVGCNSSFFTSVDAIHGRVCDRCHAWFRKSRSSLPKPMKAPITGDILVQSRSQTSKRRFQNSVTASDERRSYKNISIYITKLPPTPTNFRDEHRSSKTPYKKLAVSDESVPAQRLTERKSCKCGARGKMTQKRRGKTSRARSARMGFVSTDDVFDGLDIYRDPRMGQAWSRYSSPIHHGRDTPIYSPQSALSGRRAIIFRVKVHRNTPKPAAPNDPALELDHQKDKAAEDPHKDLDGQDYNRNGVQRSTGIPIEPFTTELLSRQWLNYLAYNSCRVGGETVTKSRD